jgi:hypothetical protein
MGVYDVLTGIKICGSNIVHACRFQNREYEYGIKKTCFSEDPWDRQKSRQ